MDEESLLKRVLIRLQYLEDKEEINMKLITALLTLIAVFTLINTFLIAWGFR